MVVVLVLGDRGNGIDHQIQNVRGHVTVLDIVRPG